MRTVIAPSAMAFLHAVLEPERVALARTDGANVVAAVGVGHRWLAVVVPQRTHDTGEPDVAALESDEHLVVDLRQKEGPVAFSDHRRREPGQVRLFWPAVPGKADPDTSQTIRIAVVSHDCDCHTGDRVIARRICAHSAPMLHQLFAPQRLERIDSRRTACRHPAGE